MAGICDALLTGDILDNCIDSGFAGIETDLVLINKSDINYAATTFSPTNPLLITNLALKTGKSGFLLKGVKQNNEVLYSLVKKETARNKFKHTFKGMILDFSVENKLRLYEMSLGGDFVVVVKTKWKGTLQKEAFQVLGLSVGLQIDKADWSSKDKDSNILFELTNMDSQEEPKPALTLLMTDYTLTDTKFTNKFLGA